jgi:DNA-directed RNA polymerase specialized sigma24 family protein
MNIQNKHQIQRINNKLFKDVLGLTNNNRDYCWDLVKEVWCKILTRDDLDTEKLSEGYLIKALRNHYYDRKRLEKPADELPESIDFLDKNENEAQIMKNMEGDKTEELLSIVWSYLNECDNGWILKKQVEGYKLKELAKADNVDYNNLRKLKSRLLSKIRERLKEERGYLCH